MLNTSAEKVLTSELSRTGVEHSPAGAEHSPTGIDVSRQAVDLKVTISLQPQRVGHMTIVTFVWI